MQRSQMPKESGNGANAFQSGALTEAHEQRAIACDFHLHERRGGDGFSRKVCNGLDTHREFIFGSVFPILNRNLLITWSTNWACRWNFF
jgi:hypothetical protein